MELREWDYNAGPSGGFVEVEYPDELIKKFVNWFRETKAWREDTPLAYSWFLKFDLDLIEFQNESKRPAPVQVEQGPECKSLTKAGTPCQITHGIVDGYCHIHRSYRALVPA